ncbi:MAG: energy transducer TonB [Pseudomonadota bacterium]
MSRLFLWACIAVATAMCGTSSALADEPRRLEGSSPWHLTYAEDSCRVVRQFGEGDNQVTLILDRYEPGDLFRLMLAGRPVRNVDADREAQVRFGEYETEQRLPFERGDLGDLPAMIFTAPMSIGPLMRDEESGLVETTAENEEDRDSVAALSAQIRQNRIAEDRYRNAHYIWVNARRMSPVRLETGSMNQLFAAFDLCLDELLTHWGIDAEAHQSLTRIAMPVSNPGRWIDSADYPREALRRGGQGLVYFRLSVDEQGNATECHIQRSTRGEHFQAAVCAAIMDNAEFAPALDADGNPIASYFVNSVYFTLRRR